MFVFNVVVGYEKIGLLEYICNLVYVDWVIGLLIFFGFMEVYYCYVGVNISLFIVYVDI